MNISRQHMDWGAGGWRHVYCTLSVPNTAAEAKWKILMRFILVWEKLMDIMQVRVEGPRWIAGATSGLGLMIDFIFA